MPKLLFCVQAYTRTHGHEHTYKATKPYTREAGNTLNIEQSGANERGARTNECPHKEKASTRKGALFDARLKKKKKTSSRIEHRTSEATRFPTPKGVLESESKISHPPATSFNAYLRLLIQKPCAAASAKTKGNKQNNNRRFWWWGTDTASVSNYRPLFPASIIERLVTSHPVFSFLLL